MLVYQFFLPFYILIDLVHPHIMAIHYMIVLRAHHKQYLWSIIGKAFYKPFSSFLNEA